ncbi:MAG: hypothetical protein MUF31_09290 [Akkermansiaceae bacterium]|nr:hypothetical protein [Akkermansiaceae bacterium]
MEFDPGCGKLASVQRIPWPAVVLLCLLVVGLVWHFGTRHYDFLTPPSEYELALVRSRVGTDLASPSDLFALPPAQETEKAEPEPEPTEAEAAPPVAAPVILDIDLPDPLPQNYWIDLKDMPAAAYVDLASRLEADARLSEALVAWERVLDHAPANPEEREIAVRAIRRIKSSVTAPTRLVRDAPTITLRVTAPNDRVEITRRAAKEVAEALSLASFRQIRFQTVVEANRKTAILEVSFGAKADDQKPRLEAPAPSTADAVETTLLTAVYKLIASTLALDGSLKPISPAPQGETPVESLSHRITRHAWSVLPEAAAR